MAYVKKILAQDEELIGIARLHWIYVLRGLFWFLIMAGGGWLLNGLIGRAILWMGSNSNSSSIPNALMTIGNGIMFFMMAGGFFVFLLFVIKVLVTEIGLSTRRVLHKEGFLFVKVHQIDHEEIRGENLDLGYLGRVLGYGYLMLDCRFVGDVRLPAIENPERFLRALHQARGQTQDALSVMVGKAGAAPLILEEQDPQKPQPAAPQPTPEIQPGQPGPQPEVQPGKTPDTPEMPPMPTPHSPPPQAPPAPPEQPPSQPAQPTPAPTPSEPPLQPPTGSVQAQPAQQPPAPPQPQQQQQQAAPIDAATIAQVVQQVMPQMAEQVVRQLSQEGLLNQPQQQADKDVDTDLMASFDDARLKKDGAPHDNDPKMEHAIH